MNRRKVCLLLLLTPFCVPVSAFGAEKFEFKVADRVVLIGNTLIEREQRYGYWETAITARYPKRDITFRNLGWSGDTVFGDAQAGFGTGDDGFKRGTALDGFKHLTEHVIALKPTVIILGYGSVESFKGEKGLLHFEDGLVTLLDALQPTGARLVLLSPTEMEALGKPLPDPIEQNKNLRLYGKRIREVAEARKCTFVDLIGSLQYYKRTRFRGPLTDDCLHLTAFGYWFSSPALEDGLSLDPIKWDLIVQADGKVIKRGGAKVEQARNNALSYYSLDYFLPRSPLPNESPQGAPQDFRERTMTVEGLGKGAYSLEIDGKGVCKATGKEWARPGIALVRGPEFDQVEKLRQTIIEKNRLYFHRWRPQNETYLFGFRKSEQGQNAREIPQFDPLIEEKEKEIAKLRVPVQHTYELVPSK
ncbi:MAG: SGNH/GDSL hydrolase family protein [Gemmataceae bacterium]